PARPISLLSMSSTQPATTEIYPLSLHDALPISQPPDHRRGDPLSRLGAVSDDRRHHDQPAKRIRNRQPALPSRLCRRAAGEVEIDRKSTRLNSSHVKISYAVFCLKKKKAKYETA